MGRRDKAMQTLLSLLQDKSKREMFANTAVFSLLLSNRGSCVPVSGTVEPTDNNCPVIFYQTYGNSNSMRC